MDKNRVENYNEYFHMIVIFYKNDRTAQTWILVKIWEQAQSKQEVAQRIKRLYHSQRTTRSKPLLKNSRLWKSKKPSENFE